MESQAVIWCIPVGMAQISCTISSPAGPNKPDYPVKLPQPDQKEVAAVPALGNSAQQAVPLIQEEKCVRQASVGLVAGAGPLRRWAATPLTSRRQYLARHVPSLVGAHQLVNSVFRSATPEWFNWLYWPKDEQPRRPAVSGPKVLHRRLQLVQVGAFHLVKKSRQRRRC